MSVAGLRVCFAFLFIIYGLAPLVAHAGKNPWDSKLLVANAPEAEVPKPLEKPETPPPAAPKEISPAVKTSDVQKLHYDVYAGGVHAVLADLTVDMSEKGRYSMFFEAETRGILETFVPWKGLFESKGWALKGGERIPELHESTAIWQEEREVKSYHYDKKDGFQDLVVSYVGKKPRTEDTDKDLAKDTTDVLTATLLIMEHISQSGNCDGSSDIFDGRRRFSLVFHHEGYSKLEKSRYNAYSGPAIACTVEVKPEGGAWHKKPRGWMSIQEQGRVRGMMPTVWFARIGDSEIAVPVRVLVKTAYGTMFMHLKTYNSGDLVLTANK
ncbi:MAG: DUF3108 domain-containing protein [Alphaproteobacteria bacterium]|nr:DUF3108 domain-containing protein [Alphaproteobacteria bacterium]